MTRDDGGFSEALFAVFGDRAAGFSDDLRESLREFWVRALQSRYRRVLPSVPEDAPPFRVESVAHGQWEVVEGARTVATISSKDRSFVVWHAPVDPAMAAQIDTFDTLLEAFQAVIRFERSLRTNAPQQASPEV